MKSSNDCEGNTKLKVSMEKITSPSSIPDSGISSSQRDRAAADAVAIDDRKNHATLVEQTIAIMNECGGITVHPLHYHSFQEVSFLLSFQTHTCVACEDTVSVLPGRQRQALVKCLSCGVLAHRSCALDVANCRRSQLQWKSSSKQCTVNRDACEQRRRQQSPLPEMLPSDSIPSAQSPGDNTGNVNRMVTAFFKLINKDGAASTIAGNSTHSNVERANVVSGSGAATAPRPVDDEISREPWLLSRWTNTQRNAPTQSAASAASAASVLSESCDFHDAGSRGCGGADAGDASESLLNDADSPEQQQHPLLPLSKQSFACIARALQENVLASFQRRRLLMDPSIITRDRSTITPPSSRRAVAPYPANRGVKQPDIPLVPTASNDAESKLESSGSRIANLADRTLEVVKSKISVSAVAGGIAGGMAGLAIAGPVGAYAGYYVAAAAGSSLMVAEATALSVVVAGIATGGMTGQQIQGHIDEHKRRILTMGEEGASKVLLVRPNVKIDPIWDQICRDAKQTAPSTGHAVPLLLKRVLRKRSSFGDDADIVHTAEDEIPTSDKVLLLVSRILNDKSSRSGHIYRYLIDAFGERCRTRQALCDDTSRSIASTSPRARRDDIHAVIKHVTAALMEERPEFGSSPGLTELTATAVEGLVFGQLYDVVFEEIVQETSELDMELWKKITAFEQERQRRNEEGNATTDGTTAPLANGLVSDKALAALRMLPQAHSAADKLHFCVRFLDCIAEHFLSYTSSNICADTLLKMVCQHLILLENQGSCNAQLVFLEEFVCDEQILCGRDGYALATLQASLHFLNSSTDFDADIFKEDGEEESPVEVLPVTTAL